MQHVDTQEKHKLCFCLLLYFVFHCEQLTDFKENKLAYLCGPKLQ